MSESKPSIFTANNACRNEDCEYRHCKLCGRHLIGYSPASICSTCAEIMNDTISADLISSEDLERWNKAVQNS